MEIDHEYKVPQGVEAYEREKRDGAVSMMVYGTPQVQALNQKLTEDKIPGTSPGFGIAASADGKRYPYLFPVAATYWSQGAAAIHFVKEKLGGSLEGKKIAYIFYDNPAGREPLPVIEDLQQLEKFELRTFAVPPPGVEMGAQVLDITQRYRPDFVIAHLFGRSPSLAIKEFKRTGYPLSKVMGLVWASAEHDILAAGGWSVAEGYHTLTFAGIGDDYPVRQEIKAMYKAQGRDLPNAMEDTVMYNRGILWAALHVEATRNALKSTGGKQPSGEDVKRGFEAIRDFTLGGLVPPLEVTAGDHEGGGWVQVFQAKGGKFVKETDWFRAYPEVVAAAVKKAE
jgi:branched-chain amino acid transport system substrate-binding protein